MSDSQAERLALDEMEPHWRSMGYTLVRQPSRADVPRFMGGYIPDAIAIGKEPQLIIEVVNPQMRSTKTKVSQLKSMVADHPEWKLELVYSSPVVLELGATSPDSIQSALAQSESLAGTEPRAALMLAWAALEALGRHLHPVLSERGMSAGKLIDLLISNGHLEQSTHAGLKALGEARNRIAHGQLDLSPTEQDVRWLVSIARSLSRPV
jgi:hypothetical protein